MIDLGKHIDLKAQVAADEFNRERERLKMRDEESVGRSKPWPLRLCEPEVKEYAEQQLLEAIGSRMEPHRAVEYTAELIRAQRCYAFEKNISIQVDHPLNVFDRDPRPDEKEAYLDRSLLLFPVPQAIDQLLNTNGPEVELRRRANKMKTIIAADELAKERAQRKIDLQAALKVALAKRQGAWNAARTERAIWNLSAAAEADSALKKKLSNPVDLLAAIAIVLATTPANATDLPHDGFIAAHQFPPLPIVED